ncbi:MAG: type III pantothenate kinase [Pseudohongiellaceae bacterium]
MILELDIGNSRIKWRLLNGKAKANVDASNEGQAIIQRAVANSTELLRSQLEPLGKPALVRACSVLDKVATANIAKLIRTHFNMDMQLAQVTRSCAGVSNQYKDPQAMGTDRWLAMLSAFHRVGGPCVVVDGGTALTVDVINAEGLHEGGYILPGQAMMRGSLEANTRIRLADSRGSDDTALGISTAQAVNNGCLAAAVALIERVLMTFGDKVPVNLLIAGGDGAALHKNLLASGRLPATCRITLASDLVLDGLALAIPLPEPTGARKK